MTVFSVANLYEDFIKRSACIFHIAHPVYRRIPLFLTWNLKLIICALHDWHQDSRQACQSCIEAFWFEYLLGNYIALGFSSFHENLHNNDESGQRIRYGDSVRAGRYGHRISVGAKFFATVQNDPGFHPTFCRVGTRSLSQGKSARVWD